MYKKTALFVLASFLVLSFASFNPIGRVFTNMAGDELEMYVNVRNPTETSFNNLKIRAYSEELGFMLYSNNFDLRHNDRVTKRMQGNAPTNIAPGEYLVRVAVNGRVRDVKYVPVIIG